MKFKQILLFALFTSLSFICRAQDNFNVNLRVSERSAFVDAVEIGDNLIFFDRRGNILPDRSNGSYYEYYGPADRDEFVGKIRAVNGLPVTYYDIFDRDELLGKVKSIGSIKFTYYDIFDRDELRGKLKSINGIPLKYYDIFDWAELRGKLRSIGDIEITYYNTFDRSTSIGKVKTVTGQTANVSVNIAEGSSSDIEVLQN